MQALMSPAEAGPKKAFLVGDESITLAQLQAAGLVAPYGEVDFITSVALTAARTIALPPLNTVGPGFKWAIKDIAGGCSSTDTLKFALNGSDQYQGGSTKPGVAAANGIATIANNGIQWNNA